MKGILVVRKYKNRRLYDTEQSTHITRDQLLEKIREGRAVQVQEAGSGEDVTVETLLQLIQSEDGLAASLLTPEFLHFLIRTDASLVAQFFRDYIPLAMQSFQQAMAGVSAMQGRGGQMFNPFGAFPNPWAGFGMPGMPGMGPAAAPPPPAPDEEDEEEASSGELDELREQMKAMQAELQKLKKKKTRR